MRKSRYTEEQIVAAVKQADAGIKIEDVCRKLGITPTTFYRWKAKFNGMEVSEAKRLKQLEDENRRLKQMVADQALDIQMLKAVVEKNGEARGAAPGRGLSAGGVRSESEAHLQGDRDGPIVVPLCQPEGGAGEAAPGPSCSRGRTSALRLTSPSRPP